MPDERVLGLMQHDHPLTVQHLVERLRRFHADREIASVTEHGVEHLCYGALVDRVDRLCGALVELGIKPGARVATLAWNTARHLETYLAVPSMGAILHALNPRFDVDQLRYTVEHARDAAIFVEGSLLPRLEKALQDSSASPTVVIFDENPGPTGPIGYESLLSSAAAGFSYPRLDDRAAAGLWYTSGTTGRPKGVLGSHRSALLHATALCMADVFGICRNDRVLPIVPMFHANAWGLPYAAALTGAGLVLPGRRIESQALIDLIAEESVTFAAAVPTIWLDISAALRRSPRRLPSLRMGACGGAKPPTSLLRELEEEHGVTVVQASGMTEGCLISVALAPDDADVDEHWRLRATTGRIVPLLDARIVADSGAELPWDGEAEGELELRGPWIASRYFGESADERFSDGWLRTGDIARMHAGGFEEITDRAKDLIKSGGEWISSAVLEAALMEHPQVLEAAVIALPDARWTERPLACIVLADPDHLGLEDLQRHLLSRFPRWWVPRAYAPVAIIPRTSVGKFDKKALRAQLAAKQLRIHTTESLPAASSA